MLIYIDYSFFNIIILLRLVYSFFYVSKGEGIMKRIVTVLLSVAAILFTIPTTKALALTSADNNAIENHPLGLTVEDYFIVNNQLTVTNQEEVGFSYNAASIKGANKDVLVLTDGNVSEKNKWNTSTYGAIWSNVSSGIDNYIDITKEQTISAWLYFGPDTDNDAAYNEQGMALVLQNDPRKDKAIGMGLQGLGVYGFDKGYSVYVANFPSITYPSDDFIKNTMISNSMALEFDTQRNDVTKNGTAPFTLGSTIVLGSGNGTYSMNGYDSRPTDKPSAPSDYPANTQLGASGGFGHIALTYPGDIRTYRDVPLPSDSTWLGYTKAKSLFHTESEPTYLIDDNDLEGNELLWHHITFKWIPHENDDKATIEYHYNDKSIDGTENFNKSGTKFVRLDKYIEVDPSQFGTVKDNKLYWGFTGANGTTKDVHSKMVVFESIPAMATGSADVMIINDDTGEIIKEGDYVPHGTPITITYKVAYEEGRQNWKDINTVQNLPTNIKYSKENSTLAITYYDDGTQVPYYNNLGGDYPADVRVRLKDLGPYNGNTTSEGSMVIHGMTENETTEDIPVSSQVANFNGSNAIASTNTPNFTIGTKKSWTLNLSGGEDKELVYMPSETAVLNLPTKLEYSDKHEIDPNDEFTYQIKVDDKAYSVKQSANELGESTLDLAELIGDDFWSIFTEDSSHKITVTATDRDNIQSNATSYNVKVIPNKLLQLHANESLNFRDVNLYDTTKILKRKSPYEVSVTSYKNPWMLSATASDLKSTTGTTFAGHLVYGFENQIKSLNEGIILIASDSNSYDTKKTSSISDNWTVDSGVLLKQIAANPAGKYSGILTWQLGDYVE